MSESEHLELFKDITITGKIKGNPGYMAPEQIHQDREKNDQTDIYALGALLYATICSKPPLEGDTKTILDHTCQGKVQFPKERFPNLNIPASLDAVVRKAMALKPEHRYQKVEDLSLEVRQFIAGFTTKAENANLAKELLFFYRRHKWICSITLTSLIIIISLTAVYQRNLNQTLLALKKEKNRAEQALDMAISNKNG